MSQRKKKSKPKPVQVAFTRFMFIVALFVIWIGAISVRLVHLQVSQHNWLRGRALDQRRDEMRIKMLRGSILDRSGRVLALSVKVNSLMADPGEIEDVPGTARAVASVLGVKPDQFISDITEAKKNGKRFVWLSRRLDEDTVNKINESLYNADLKKYDAPRFAGLHWREEQKRTYPQGTLAAHVVGFSNVDDLGQAGIEQSQEKILRGEIENVWRDRDRLGRVYDEEISEKEPAKDVVLTISQTIQYKVEQALARGVTAAKAKSGSAIAMNPKTGEILAMANYPTFDPNNFGAASPKEIANISVQNQFTPGSVFKLVTFSAALEKRLIEPENEIDCSPAEIRIAGHLFKDSHKIGVVSYSNALAHSSNYAAIKTGLRLGNEPFYSHVRKFGFGTATGIELPAEANGAVRPPKTWASDSLASMSIGYEVSVTALQTASAFATIANGGMRAAPHIIQGIRQQDGTIVPSSKKPDQRVVSEDTANELREMLKRVVTAGTGSRAVPNGYSAAGKTGTAWKYDSELDLINREKLTSSFVGFAPAEKPAIVIAVVIDEPEIEKRDGGHVAAPVFREIAQQVLPELEILPDANLIRADETIAQFREIKIPTRAKQARRNLTQNESPQVAKATENKATNEKLKAKPAEETREVNESTERKSKTGAVKSHKNVVQKLLSGMKKKLISFTKTKSSSEKTGLRGKLET